MRNTSAKSILRECWAYSKRMDLTSAEFKLLYRRAKKFYNNTPRTERYNFSIFQ